MSDLIDRQAAIDAAERESQIDGAYGYMDTKSIVDMLNDLPSAQPETTTMILGKERYGVRLWYKCSNCGEPCVSDDNYCSYCGRKFINNG